MRELSRSYSPIPSQGKQNDQQMLDTILIRSSRDAAEITYCFRSLLTDSPSSSLRTLVRNLPEREDFALSLSLSLSLKLGVRRCSLWSLSTPRSIDRSKDRFTEQAVFYIFNFLHFFLSFFFSVGSEIIYWLEEAWYLGVPETRKPREGASDDDIESVIQ